MHLPSPRLTIRGLLLIVTIAALGLGGWVEWTGRRPRAVQGARRQGVPERELSIRIDRFLGDIRRVEGKQPTFGSLDDLIARLNLSPPAARSAAGREPSTEERRLIAEHEAARLEVGRYGPYVNVPIAFQSLKTPINFREMIEPGWLAYALREEAYHRGLRKQYERAINRPWVAVPPGGLPGER